MADRIWVIRHGDRYDFDIGKPAWELLAQTLNDPVLSDLGKQQATQMALAIKTASGEKLLTRVLTSPFIRCIQTADPLAGQFDTELQIDNSLFEVVYTTEEFPALTNRAHYYPRVSLKYISEPRPAVDETFPQGAMDRYGMAAQVLAKKFPGETIAMVTHAAGVSAIVASLCNITVREVGPVFPASIFCLEKQQSSGFYRILPEFNGSVDHLSQPMGKTLSWPRPSDCSDDWGQQWINCGETASWVLGRDDHIK